MLNWELGSGGNMRSRSLLGEMEYGNERRFEIKNKKRQGRGARSSQKCTITIIRGVANHPREYLHIPDLSTIVNLIKLTTNFRPLITAALMANIARIKFRQFTSRRR